MTRTWTLMVFILLSLAIARPLAQGVGVRVGVSADPDQFYGGVHYETDELLERLRFRPNAEIGVGDDVTLVAFNFEFACRVPLQRTAWSVYVGGGPALNVYRSTRNTQPDGGFNMLFGLAHRGGIFTELKVGLLSSPSIKLGVGYAFHR